MEVTLRARLQGWTSPGSRSLLSHWGCVMLGTPLVCSGPLSPLLEKRDNVDISRERKEPEGCCGSGGRLSK